MRKITENNNFTYFAISLVVFLLLVGLNPLIYQKISAYILSLSLGCVFVISLFSLRFDDKWRGFLISLLCIFVSGKLLFFIFPFYFDYLFDLSVMFVFLCGVFKNAAKQIFFGNCCMYNKIVGSFSLFLVTGILWAIVYMFCIRISPSSISGFNMSDTDFFFSDAIYFSFSTLTSLGLGDILPKSSIVRILVSIEAVVGLFYMAVVVASIVGMKRK